LKSHLVAYLAGALFGLGLVLGGMTEPAKVVGFLDFLGDWDPSLAFVMLGAIGIHFVLFRLIMRRASPLLDTRFHMPTRREIDRPLILGSAIFGVGWGLAGFCPGPGIVCLGTGASAAIVFGAAMLLGMGAHARFVGVSARRAANEPDWRPAAPDDEGNLVTT
jgi:uncharacterized membrane protein YedE/YeeE